MKKALILAAVLFMAAGCSTKPEVSNEEKFLNHFKGYSTAIDIAPGSPGTAFLSILENGRRLPLSISSIGEALIFVRAESENSAIYLINSSEYSLVFTSATEFTLSDGTVWALKK